MGSNTQSSLLPIDPPTDYPDPLSLNKILYISYRANESQIPGVPYTVWGQSVHIATWVLDLCQSPMTCRKRREKPDSIIWFPMSSFWVGWGKGGLGHNPPMSCVIMEGPSSRKHLFHPNPAFTLEDLLTHPFSSPSYWTGSDKTRLKQNGPSFPFHHGSPLKWVKILLSSPAQLWEGAACWKDIVPGSRTEGSG